MAQNSAPPTCPLDEHMNENQLTELVNIGMSRNRLLLDSIEDTDDDLQARQNIGHQASLQWTISYAGATIGDTFSTIQSALLSLPIRKPNACRSYPEYRDRYDHCHFVDPKAYPHGPNIRILMKQDQSIGGDIKYPVCVSLYRTILVPQMLIVHLGH